MKILIGMGTKYLPAHGGAQKSVHCLVEGLAQRGHDCRLVVMGVHPTDQPAREKFLTDLAARGIELSRSSDGADILHRHGVEVHNVWENFWQCRYLIAQAQTFDPDWIIIAEDWTNLLEAVRTLGPERFIYLIQSTMLLPFGPMSGRRDPAKAKLFRQVAGVVTLSNYLQAYVRRWGGREAARLTLPVYGSAPFPQYENFSQGTVMLINACAVKGLPIFLQLARALPEVPFAAVTGWGTTAAERAELEALPNITLLAPVDNIDELYAQTRVLLAPSLCDEGFGMVVVEAMLRGIPVLASNYGGLPEAKLGVDYLLPIKPLERYVSGAGDDLMPIPVVPEQDAAVWQTTLQALLSDREQYQRLSAQSRAAALAFVNSLSLEPYETYLNDLKHAPRNPETVAAAPSEQSLTGDPVLDRLDRLSPEKRALLARRLVRSDSNDQ
jgi:glycosyltransferase involved in cell wall biosynthesis